MAVWYQELSLAKQINMPEKPFSMNTIPYRSIATGMMPARGKA